VSFVSGDVASTAVISLIRIPHLRRDAGRLAYDGFVEQPAPVEVKGFLGDLARRLVHETLAKDAKGRAGCLADLTVFELGLDERLELRRVLGRGPSRDDGDGVVSDVLDDLTRQGSHTGRTLACP
jgi:hypothetical protein